MDAAGGQLPPGEVADGRNEKQKRVGRGDIANKTKGAICPPLGAGESFNERRQQVWKT